jgi:hypothetical protein
MSKNSRRTILVLLDSPEIRREVLRYSVELARRTGAGIFFLMLLRREIPPAVGEPVRNRVEGNTLFNAGQSALAGCLEQTGACGVEVEGTVRRGDPPSELLKFLAEARPFQVVIWGGNEAFLRARRLPVRGHWLERIREELDCALVVPSLKRKRA